MSHEPRHPDDRDDPAPEVPRKELADAKAEIAKLTECVVAADELRNYMGEGYALVAKYDEARKDVKI